MITPTPEQMKAREWLNGSRLWIQGTEFDAPCNEANTNSLALLLRRVALEAQIEILERTQGVVSEPGDFMYSTGLVAHRLRAILAAIGKDGQGESK